MYGTVASLAPSSRAPRVQVRSPTQISMPATREHEPAAVAARVAHPCYERCRITRIHSSSRFAQEGNLFPGEQLAYLQGRKYESGSGTLVLKQALDEAQEV